MHFLRSLLFFFRTRRGGRTDARTHARGATPPAAHARASLLPPRASRQAMVALTKKLEATDSLLNQNATTKWAKKK